MIERIKIRTPATPRRIGIICSEPDWQRLPSKPHLKRFFDRIGLLNLNFKFKNWQRYSNLLSKFSFNCLKYDTILDFFIIAENRF